MSIAVGNAICPECGNSLVVYKIINYVARHATLKYRLVVWKCVKCNFKTHGDYE